MSTFFTVRVGVRGGRAASCMVKNAMLCGICLQNGTHLPMGSMQRLVALRGQEQREINAVPVCHAPMASKHAKSNTNHKHGRERDSKGPLGSQNAPIRPNA